MPRFVHYREDQAARWGRVEGDRVIRLDGPPWSGGAPGAGAPIPLSGLDLLAPASPTKIIGIGRNYRAHAAELGHAAPAEPLLFLKPPSAAIGDGDTIILPTGQGWRRFMVPSP